MNKVRLIHYRHFWINRFKNLRKRAKHIFAGFKLPIRKGYRHALENFTALMLMLPLLAVWSKYNW
jgi:hypothetical protein